MTFWEYLNQIGERRARIILARPRDARLLANIIGGGLISGFLGSLITLFFVPIPSANEQIITYMIGQLSGMAGGIVAYHYTMTAGQKELDAKRADTSNEAVKGLSAAVNSLTGNIENTDQSTLKDGDSIELKKVDPDHDGPDGVKS